ncbi:Protein O-linked-mannose beta-1,4-N-acetylglucosaminyltransferase 2 [Araneus ventricosus]|uniref:Protein O-linked-mannose beta-1,4-N-acetylglucosaminyltransferase 2 n=1 Tax=Araneus ventricosus TaxID=182803 RepID=A0A4Y2J5F7_ARAVE|nr:Protein O-linked-mannose beta-1,4-N-acetylglucosaminyltransferase 2 [Araneus ventricosus]
MNIFCQLLLPSFFAVILVLIFKFPADGKWNFQWRSFSLSLDFKYKYFTDINQSSSFYTSVFCRGSNHTDRLCRFRNLCFDPKYQLFVFFQNSLSVKTGVPVDRFSPALTDFSSVSDHNTQYFNYVELPHFSAKEFNITFNHGHGLMFKRFNPDNLMHVFHDDLLPIFATLDELSLLNNPSAYIIAADSKPPGAYADLYENFLNSKPLYIHSLSKDHLHCFENAYVGLNKASVWYQYGFREPQGPLQKPHAGSIIISFRDYFIKQFSLMSHQEEKHVSLLVRKYNRKILNADKIVKAISSISGYETHTLSLDESSVLEVIQEILRSHVIVAMHGSLLILSLFLEPYSVVIELFPFGIHPDISTAYKTLCEFSELKLFYRAWQNNFKSNSFPHPEYPPEWGGILHLPSEEQKDIQSSVVMPFLCCDNPVWLYRIYQDTVVDMHSFVTLLQAVLEERDNYVTPEKHQNTYRLYPGEVSNGCCNVSDETLTLVWEQPWNLRFFDGVQLEYEVWLQDIEGDDVQAFLMKTNKFVFPVKSATKTYYAWIRCHANGLIGPFTSNPIICNYESNCSKTS